MTLNPSMASQHTKTTSLTPILTLLQWSNSRTSKKPRWVSPLPPLPNSHLMSLDKPAAEVLRPPHHQQQHHQARVPSLPTPCLPTPSLPTPPQPPPSFLTASFHRATLTPVSTTAKVSEAKWHYSKALQTIPLPHLLFPLASSNHPHIHMTAFSLPLHRCTRLFHRPLGSSTQAMTDHTVSRSTRIPLLRPYTRAVWASCQQMVSLLRISLVGFRLDTVLFLVRNKERRVLCRRLHITVVLGRLSGVTKGWRL
jgi:hypothetical protein